MTQPESLLLQEMKSEDDMEEMLFDDSDGELIDAVNDSGEKSIFSDDPEEGESEDIEDD